MDFDVDMEHKLNVKMMGGGLVYLLFIVIFLTNGSLCNRNNEDAEFPKVNVEKDASCVQDIFPRNSKAFIKYIAPGSNLWVNELPFSRDKLPKILFKSYKNPMTKENPSLISNAIIATNIDNQYPSQMENKTSNIKNVKQTIECALRVQRDDEVPSIAIINSSMLFVALKRNETANSTIKECAVVLFFSPECVFSARMAPHYNAIARVFPGIHFYALDVTKELSVELQFGVIGVPSVYFYHGGRFFKGLNETVNNIDNLVSFITRHTSLTHSGVLNVTSIDMYGPVPSILTMKTDYALILAWLFTITCICAWLIRSSFCHRMVESIKNTWHEAEAQHDHAD